MFHRIYVPLVVITQSLVLVDSQHVIEACVENRHENRSVLLQCANGLISEVNVISGVGECTTGAERCIGMTPTVMVNYMNCYWQNKCFINWPRDPIIYMEPNGNSRTCIGSQPNFMKISYKCFQPTDQHEDDYFVRSSGKDVQPKRLLIDVCNNLENRESIYRRTGNKKSNMAGIIRSHKLYPWDYSGAPRECSFELYWPEKQRFLVYTVKNLDLSDADSLTIMNKDMSPVNVNSTGTSSFSNGLLTSFNFSVGTESNSGKGFFICFKFTSDSTEKEKDTCESIMTDGHVETVKDVQEPLLWQHAIVTSPVTTTQLSTTEKPNTTVVPKACLKKKSEKAKQRCIKRRQNRERKRNKNKGKGKGKRRRKNKNENRKRRHSGRRNH